MSIANTVNVLRRTMAFGSLGDDRLNVLAFSAERVRFAAGETLLAPGEEPARCLVVLEGEVQIGGEDGAPSPEGMGPGATIGEMALISNNPADLAVTGRGPGEILVITRPLIERLAADFPDIVVHLREAMRSRLGRTLSDLVRVENRLRRPPGKPPDRVGRGPARGRTGDPGRAPRRPR